MASSCNGNEAVAKCKLFGNSLVPKEDELPEQNDEMGRRNIQRTNNRSE